LLTLFKNLFKLVICIIIKKEGGYMKEKDISSRNEALEKMISEAQNMPGIMDLMLLYGKLNELMLKSKTYLSVYAPKITSSLGNSSS
jgi:hypothetical protein